ncbi:MAG: thioredoxin domain-containing protein [Deltaproteobacteria bacterium]|nr:thioredoxin domain-containing protein [Deltaproteobacteria bacterium]
MSTNTHTNRLAGETSPYLLQHAHNPVDWFPWGDEAFTKSQQENKPVLLSIGYSACHWCHVMERESFENEEIAAIMNEHYINIKVDREERPDLDGIYMQCVQMLTGQGGWPMTVFLTPDGVPFYGGTYFPPEDRQGIPGFQRVLLALSDAYRKNPGQIRQSAGVILQNLREINSAAQSGEAFSEAILESAFRKLSRNFDHRHGGFGGAPKFPSAMSLSFFFRYSHRAKDKSAREMTELTLRKMAEGGIYDQVGGGFHRYTVDDHWLVPHFEKMLYDNALLVSLYVDAYQITKNPFYRQIAEDSLDYVIREMTGEDGEFYSTQDADSEGAEGKYYVWTEKEIKSILGEKEGELFCQYYGVTQPGNFEGGNILTGSRTYEQVAKRVGTTAEQVEEFIRESKKKIRMAREARVKPYRDEKALAGWNGLMLSAFAKAARAWDRPDYLLVAEKNGDFMLTHLYREGKLLHSYKDGRAPLDGYLDDYACVIDSFIELYQSTFDFKWLKKATELAAVMIELFWDDENGAFFFTAKDHEKLIVRTKDFYDSATPSGNSLAALDLLKLAVVTGRDEYRVKAEHVFQNASTMAAESPSAFSQLLCALDYYFAGAKEIVLAGEKTAPSLGEFKKRVFRHYLPNAVVLFCDSGDKDMPLLIPSLQGKGPVHGKTAVYVCENFTCKEPLTEGDEIDFLLTQ